MEFERISFKAAVLWEILAALSGTLLVTLILIIFAPHTWLWYTLLWVTGAIYVLAAFLYIPLAYESAAYAISENAVVCRKGVIFPSTQILYRDRIAFVTIYNTPLTPILKTSSLFISAAGGDIRIFFIRSDRALEIAALLGRGSDNEQTQLLEESL